MELDHSPMILSDTTNTKVQMPQTPEPSPFKRPVTSFSPRPDNSSGFNEPRYLERKGNLLSGILSPPPSPSLARQVSEVPSDLGPSIHNRDPVLFDHMLNGDDSQRPLFESSERLQTPAPTTVSKLSASPLAKEVQIKVQRKEVNLPKFRSNVWQECFRNPAEYYRRERAYLKLQTTAAKAARTAKLVVHETPVKSIPPSPRKTHQRSRSTGSEILAARKDKVRIQRNADNKVTKPKFSRQSKPLTTAKKDIHYSTVEDLTASTDLLPDNPRCLHVDWSGAPLDISNDPDRHLLHKAEQHLASTLKLSCGQYLTQKRLIFLERVTRLRAGNPVFSRTHAQQVCHIDVNKASRLFAAFEKVGWLAPQALKQYL